MFPHLRLQRLRRTEALRDIVGETRLYVPDLVYPLFAAPGQGVKEESSSSALHSLGIEERLNHWRVAQQTQL